MKIKIIQAGVISAILFCLCAAGAGIDGSSYSDWILLLGSDGTYPERVIATNELNGTVSWVSFQTEGLTPVGSWLLNLYEKDYKEARYAVLRYKSDQARQLNLRFIEDGDDIKKLDDCIISQRGHAHSVSIPLTTNFTEQVVAVDLAGISSADPISALNAYVKFITNGIPGRLLLTIEMTNSLPLGCITKPLLSNASASTSAVVQCENLAWSLTTNGGLIVSSELTTNGYKIICDSSGTSGYSGQEQQDMGLFLEAAGVAAWTADLPLSVADMRYYAVRYRRNGNHFAFDENAVLNLKDSAGTVVQTLLKAGDMVSGGAWRTFRGEIPANVTNSVPNKIELIYSATMNTGDLEFDKLILSSSAIELPINELIDYSVRTNLPSGFQTCSLPSGYAGPGSNSFARLLLDDWFSSTNISVQGIPFEIASGFDGILFTDAMQTNSLNADIPSGTKEIYLLMAADFPFRQILNVYGSYPLLSPLPLLTEPEQMTVGVEYSDGTIDEMIPISLTNHQYGVCHGLEAYVIPVQTNRMPQKVVINDRMRNAGFGIVGLTVNTTETLFERPEIDSSWYSVAVPAVSAPVGFNLATNGTISWGSICSEMLNGTLDLGSIPLFTLEIGTQTVNSTQFTVTSRVDNAGTILIQGVNSQWGLAAALEVKTNSSSAEMTLDLKNCSGKAISAKLQFPYIRDLVLDGSITNTWYFFPRIGGVVHNRNASWREAFGENHPLQVGGFFNPVLGAGISFMSADTNNLFRLYNLAKNNTGCMYSIEYPSKTVPANEYWTSIPVTVSVIPGDWHSQYNSYMALKSRWYSPLVPRKKWFRNVFAFQGTGIDVDDPLSRRIDFSGRAAVSQKANGFCDFFHIYGWSANPVDPNPDCSMFGDYRRFDGVGGQTAFIDAIDQVRGSSVPVGLYANGYLAYTNNSRVIASNLVVDCGQIKNSQPVISGTFKSAYMCPYSQKWRNYLISDLGWLIGQTGTNQFGIYIDQFGRNFDSLICYSTNHGHASPSRMAPGEPDFAREIRNALSADVPLYSEMAACDTVSQYLDGGYSHVTWYGYWQGAEKLSPHAVNLQRFALPEFKIFDKEYSVSQKNGNWRFRKRFLFNGIGLSMKDTSPNNDPEATQFVQKAFNLLHTYSDSFNSANVWPLVQTEVNGVYVNRFSGPEDSIWTVYNSGFETVRGPVVRVPYRNGAVYYDVWNDRPVSAQVDGNTALLSFEVGPRGMACIATEASLFNSGFETDSLGFTPPSPWVLMDSSSLATATVGSNTLFGSSNALVVTDSSSSNRVILAVLDNFSGNVLRYRFSFRETSNGGSPPYRDGPLYFHVGNFTNAAGVADSSVVTLTLDDGVLSAGTTNISYSPLTGVHSIDLVVNLSTEGLVNYDSTSNTLASGRFDLYLDGMRVVAGGPVATNSVAPMTAFAFATDSTGTQQVRIDDVAVRRVLSDVLNTIWFSDGFEPDAAGVAPPAPWTVLTSGTLATATVASNTLFGSTKALTIDDRHGTNQVCLGVLSAARIFSNRLVRFKFSFRETSGSTNFPCLDGQLQFEVGRYSDLSSLVTGTAIRLEIDDGILNCNGQTHSYGTAGSVQSLELVVNTTDSTIINYDESGYSLSPRACDIFLGSNRVISNVPTFTNFEGAVDSFIFETKTTETQQVRVDDVEVRSVLWGKSELMAMADEPVVAPGSTDSDGDGLPDWWETEYFDGSADPDALAANGVNTLRQAYIAGLDPLDPAASLNVFFISLNPPIIGWNSSSGRVYNVYWTRALAEGFLPLETNISWLRPVFTNEDSETAGFFKIDVHESLSTQ